MLVAQASFTQNITITTAYDTLGEEGLSFSLNEGEVTTLFTNAELLPMLHKITSRVPSLKNVIYNGSAAQKVLDDIRAAFPHLNIVTLQSVREDGIKNPADPVIPQPEDIGCIMYTSGSTGTPKGVVLTHANIIAGGSSKYPTILPVAGARGLVEKHICADDSYLAFLPLAHILEFVVESYCLFGGVTLGYGTVRTLTNASVRNCLGDICELKPSLMIGVPAVWETIRKGIVAKLNQASPLQRKIFDIASAIKWQCLKLGLPTGILDKIVFKKIQEQTGGRLRWALSGGAPIPRETQQFLSTALCPILQGYGMTETVGLIAVQLPTDPAMLGRCGPPASSVEIMLVAVEETSYSPKNRPRPQGEIWVRGPSIMKGYYKQPAVTAETVSSDGWLMTGDVGEWNPDGTISIIDRKKNLVKLANGEYIALEKLEAVYKMAQWVTNLALYADSEQNFAVALVVPNEKELRSLADAKGATKPGDNIEFKDLVAKKEVVAAALAELRSIARATGLKPAEIVGGLYITDDEWTPENGFLTAAQKLKRKDINTAYKDNIAAIYKPVR
ncbi:hypothetical protein BDK51DRAFT_51537 [Blyttiomyces helicus]|uniref:AMP-dependent synthetase/ligase domain-containing protein n=1 Tax=Blyttiomyces helicus TaxID=388810 RepID=A0A4P9WKF1_9FUNG|nr:hypothetical protein BDK51DRAFT_51537 [Blyttiomyces helicus]|eukprot:RKO93451.1 hypothetical protein BDK51DRAFT_51537 [Blyttiomyces helicus]